ncbi:Meiotically up-regulated protein 86 protein [Microsporum canis]|uniref:Meiotically up-regulated gene 86 protein n=1 Tax=Arthroderma otae (strain ATCC MYA-4605 / CBS 113480) TaxID=554155 RepID=C5FFY3_ARTOC|nr:meiotically up-regulated gene 86 protein [Microsporum canis CBS 113480]EEQ29668.1 meiotically up-regulated gene 86 protein [Microsporum canis CBS 113480]
MGSDAEKDMVATTTTHDSSAKTMSMEEREVAEAAARYGYGPLANGSNNLAAFGKFQPSSEPPPLPKSIANPGPLGLSAFALTTMVLSLINMQARGVTAPHLVVASAFGYGGLVQLLAGMWEMAVGNTFGATALSSYGGFWISYGIIFTPGGFNIIANVEKANGATGINNVTGFWLMSWWIFTTLCLACTLKTNIAFFLLFLTLDLAFLFLGVGHLIESAPGKVYTPLIKTGGFFGILAALLAWYCALSGMAEPNNSYVKFPLGRLPWMGNQRVKTEREVV